MAKPRRDRWPELRALVADDDGLPTREAGPWTFEKLWWWNRYIEITTMAMVGKPQWPSVVYVDLFAGPGVCSTRRSGESFPGSALLAANAPKPFNKLIFCEEDPELAAACTARLQAHGAAHRSVVITGDCNLRIREIVDEIPSGALTVAFVDPTGLHAEFSTLQMLTVGRRVDLVILFADCMDIVRNIAVYAEQSDSKLDRVLGPDSNWRVEWRNLGNQSPTNVARLFIQIFKQQLARHLGYVFTADEVLKNTKGDAIYRLVYASKSDRGLDFWNKITMKERNSNRLF
ncbi:MAG: three-Cys-motif partner protein TcmP [Planctomycetota bacterium]|nr:three-Cys-motif partner protein TcmP [Planctomycetota bacterium]